MTDGTHGWQEAAIPGVLRRSLTVHGDSRGSFRELWRDSWTHGLPDHRFVQANLSESSANVLRGIHFHARQADLWIVLDGEARVALVDLRGAAEGSAAARVDLFPMRAGEVVYIPRLVAHGFYAVTPIRLMYLVTNEYDDSDERGIAWDDPDLAVPWGVTEPILSGRDQTNPSLRDALARLER